VKLSLRVPSLSHCRRAAKSNQEQRRVPQSEQNYLRSCFPLVQQRSAASPARTPPSGEASWLGCSPSSPPPTVVNIGADMPRWTSRNIRGQPWAVWKISNKPDLATKRNPWSLCWLVGGGLSTRSIVGLIGHGLFQVAHPRSVSPRRYKTTPLRSSVNSSGRIACVSFLSRCWVGRRMHHIVPQPALLSLAYPR
jgi:hypothetical protein